MKKLTSLVLCLVVVFTLALPASAALQYDYIDSIWCSLNIDDTWGIATCSGIVSSTDDVTLEIEVRLRKYDDGWKTLKTWYGNGTVNATAGGQYAVAHGYRYQTHVTAYIYQDGQLVETEIITQDKYY